MHHNEPWKARGKDKNWELSWKALINELRENKLNQTHAGREEQYLRRAY